MKEIYGDDLRWALSKIRKLDLTHEEEEKFYRLTAAVYDTTPTAFVMTNFGESKLQAIKALRQHCPEYSLREAKVWVEDIPKKFYDAKLARALEAAGATVIRE